MGKNWKRVTVLVTVLWLLPSSFHLNCQVNVGVVFFLVSLCIGGLIQLIFLPKTLNLGQK